uniref:(California timema) hypothetical protein n=1 Tax=Timema californicum TaxID=61474 RepID=A0A7R9JIZ2_TIMCA|nr:unnamed protein product [Timema californicum]
MYNWYFTDVRILCLLLNPIGVHGIERYCVVLHIRTNTNTGTGIFNKNQVHIFEPPPERDNAAVFLPAVKSKRTLAWPHGLGRYSHSRLDCRCRRDQGSDFSRPY